jgi:hypothetical protein
MQLRNTVFGDVVQIAMRPPVRESERCFVVHRRQLVFGIGRVLEFPSGGTRAVEDDNGETKPSRGDLDADRLGEESLLTGKYAGNTVH